MMEEIRFGFALAHLAHDFRFSLHLRLDRRAFLHKSSSDPIEVLGFRLHRVLISRGQRHHPRSLETYQEITSPCDRASNDRSLVAIHHARARSCCHVVPIHA